jgi:hypothetical protein
MDNSKRNLIIFAVIFFIGCLFVGMISLIGVGALGYLMTTERAVITEPTNESIINVPDITPTSANDTQTDEITPTATPQPTTTLHPQNTPVATQPEIPPDIAVQMDQIEQEVIELRKLQPSGSVSRSLLSRSQLRQNIENDFFEDYSSEEAQDDSIALISLGLLESGFDMFTFYQALLSEQIAGQYDHEKKEMDVIQGLDFGGPERWTYAHEYAHALQDQNFDIENGLNYTNEACEEDSERCAAVQALLEGDASMLELEWFYNYATPEDVQDIQDFYSEYESPIFDSAPNFLREDFVFPYRYGLLFVEYLFDLGGWEMVDSAYSDLPVSAEQIIHPERYPDDKPIPVNLPELSPLLGDEWREVDRGILGEWYTYLVLAHGLNPEARLSELEAQAASDGWGGDAYIVYYNEINQNILLVVHTMWESTGEATQFYNSFQRHSTGRFGAPTTVRLDHLAWTHEDGYTELHAQDQFTTWILAPNEDLAQAIWTAIQAP